MKLGTEPRHPELAPGPSVEIRDDDAQMEINGPKPVGRVDDNVAVPRHHAEDVVNAIGVPRVHLIADVAGNADGVIRDDAQHRIALNRGLARARTVESLNRA